MIGAVARLYRRGQLVGKYDVANLSARGALLRGEAAVERGKPVRVVLELPGVGPIPVAGSVQRIESAAGRVHIAIVFPYLSPADRRVIEGVLRSSRLREERSTSPAILIFDGREAERGALERELTALGRRWFVAATPLDAILVLNDPDESIEAVILHAGTGGDVGLELVKFFSEQSGLRTIVLEDDEHDESARRAVARFAHGFLPAQWDRWRLQQVLA